jgi:hypothetical protein
MNIHDRWIHICDKPVMVVDGSTDDSHAETCAASPHHIRLYKPADRHWQNEKLTGARFFARPG